MTKQTNPNIGHIDCPICKEVAAVRKNRGGRFYFDCMHCGRITPNHSGGQRYVMDTATIWGASGAPETVPAWIREQWPYGKSVRHRSLESGALQQVQAAPAANDEADKMSAPPAAPGELPPPPRRPDPDPRLHDPDQQPEPARGFGFLNF